MSNSVRFVRFAGLDLSDLPISATDGQTDGRTDEASYRDAWTHLKRRGRTPKQELRNETGFGREDLRYKLSLSSHQLNKRKKENSNDKLEFNSC